MATLVSPYTTMVLQVAGIVAGAAVLVMIVRGVPRRAAVPTAVAVLLTVLTVSQLWQSSGSFDSVRAGLALAPGIGEREQCHLEGSRSDLVEFSRWVAERVPADVDANIYIAGGAFDRPCLQYTLLPRRIVSDASQARYVLYVGPTDAVTKRRLAAERRRPAGDRRIEFFTPTFALERRG